MIGGLVNTDACLRLRSDPGRSSKGGKPRRGGCGSPGRSATPCRYIIDSGAAPFFCEDFFLVDWDSVAFFDEDFFFAAVFSFLFFFVSGSGSGERVLPLRSFYNRQL